MAAKFVVFLACLALGSGAAPRAKREDAAGAGNPLQDVQKHAGEFLKTFTEQLNSLTTSKDAEAFQKALKDGNESILQQLSSLSTSLQSAITDATGKTKEALEATRTNLAKTADDLRAAHPDLEQNAGVLKDKLQAAVQNAVQETQKLAQQVSANLAQTNEKLAPKVREAYDDFVKQAQDVQKKVHEAANKQ